MLQWVKCIWGGLRLVWQWNFRWKAFSIALWFTFVLLGYLWCSENFKSSSPPRCGPFHLPPSSAVEWKSHKTIWTLSFPANGWMIRYLVQHILVYIYVYHSTLWSVYLCMIPLRMTLRIQKHTSILIVEFYSWISFSSGDQLLHETTDGELWPQSVHHEHILLYQTSCHRLRRCTEMAEKGDGLVTCTCMSD